MNGNNKIHIIGEGSVGKYIHTKLFSHGFSSNIHSARDIVANRNFVENLIFLIKNRITKNHSLRDILGDMDTGSRVLYTGKSGKSLDLLVEHIRHYNDAILDQLYIFGVNGLQYSDNKMPRLVLNHAIKEDQLQGKLPEAFLSSGFSYFYHPSPTDFDREFIKALDFQIQLTSDTELYQSKLYLKFCANIIFNSITVSQNTNIGDSVKYFQKYYGENFLDKCIDELFLVMDTIFPGILIQEDLQKEIYFLLETIPHVFPSSVHQFWKIENGRLAADYENSDLNISLTWILQQAQEYDINTPMLRIIFQNIIGRGNRNNGAHFPQDNVEYFARFQPHDFQYHTLINTGVKSKK